MAKKKKEDTTITQRPKLQDFLNQKLKDISQEDGILTLHFQNLLLKIEGKNLFVKPEIKNEKVE